MRTRIINALASGCLLVIVILSGCAEDNFVGTQVGNKAPAVWLTTAPPEGSTVHYQVHMFWGGFDEDGTIDHFEWCITDNGTGSFDPADTTGSDKWHSINTGDSTFFVTADALADSATIGGNEMKPYEFRRSHTFFIRAVDDDGSRSKAEYRSFTARTLSPTITILFPKIPGTDLALAPPLTIFQWTARDYIGDMSQPQSPAAVRSIIINTNRFGSDDEAALNYIRSHPDAPEWTDWIAYDAPGDSGRFWQPQTPLALARYVFAVQARDEAGAVSPVFDRQYNVRHIRVDDRITGPVLKVTNAYLRFPILTSSAKSPPTVLNVPAGLPLEFEFSADASSYGGVVSGYRYGWDIPDIENDDWDIGYTPFIGATAKAPTRYFFFGVHTLHVEVRDNSGFITRAPITINVLPFTMDKNVLIVDDYIEGVPTGWEWTHGAVPSDEEHDAFWGEVLQDLDNFNVQRDTYPPHYEPVRRLPLDVMMQYRAIIWVARADPTKTGLYNAYLEDVVRFNSPEPNILKMYLTVGGRVLICGEQPMSSVMDKVIFPDLPPWYTGPGPGYPVILRYELDGDQFGHWEEDGMEIGVHGVGDGSFGYTDCCLNVLDITWGLDFNKSRRFCRVNGVRSYQPREEGLRAAYSIDTRHGDFPRLELRPEVAGPGKFYNESQFGIRSDIYNPMYFNNICNRYAELIPSRGCFKPIYAMECVKTNSPVYGAPVAYWLTSYGARTNPDGVAAWSAIWGFAPVYFKPEQVREALDIILFDEWKMNRVATPAD